AYLLLALHQVGQGALLLRRRPRPLLVAQLDAEETLAGGLIRRQPLQAQAWPLTRTGPEARQGGQRAVADQAAPRRVTAEVRQRLLTHGVRLLLCLTRPAASAPPTAPGAPA